MVSPLAAVYVPLPEKSCPFSATTRIPLAVYLPISVEVPLQLGLYTPSTTSICPCPRSSHGVPLWCPLFTLAAPNRMSGSRRPTGTSAAGTARSSNASSPRRGRDGRRVAGREEAFHQEARNVEIDMTHLLFTVGLRYNGEHTSQARRPGAGAVPGRWGACLAVRPHRPPC